MASSCFPAPPPAGAAALQLPSCWAARPHEWGRGERPASGGGSSSSSSSPTPSPDSCSSLSPSSRPWPRAALGGNRGGRPRRGPGQQRQSASQREKLRMRHLARALRTLRRYLPASVAPAGQSLTKIETLRLAIRYIGHLSELLGLREEEEEEETPARPRGPPSSSPAPGPEAWPLPPHRSPRATGAPSSSSFSCCHGCCCRRRPSSPEPPPGPDYDDDAWLCAAAAAATCCSDAPKPREDERPAASAAGRTRAEAVLPPPPELPVRARGLSAQSLPLELLAFLEGFLPPASHD